MNFDYENRAQSWQRCALYRKPKNFYCLLINIRSKSDIRRAKEVLLQLRRAGLAVSYAAQIWMEYMRLWRIFLICHNNIVAVVRMCACGQTRTDNTMKSCWKLVVEYTWRRRPYTISIHITRAERIYERFHSVRQQKLQLMTTGFLLYNFLVTFFSILFPFHLC